MSDLNCVFRARFAFRLALTGAAAGLLAGCANSERLSDPLSNPFQTSANVPEQAPGVAASMPVSPVQSRPLSAPTASAGASSQPAPRMAAVSPPRSGSGQSPAGWSAQGGSPVVVAQGETAVILANRYGIPLDALVRTNGFSSASQIQPGTRVIIPVYNAALAKSSGAPASGTVHQTQQAKAKAGAEPPRTLASQAASLKSAKGSTLASKDTAEPSAKAAQKLAQKSTTNSTAPNQKVASATSVPNSPAVTAKSETTRTGKAETSRDAKDSHDSTSAEPVKASAPPSEAANPEFRWPARGRIIQAFKPGGNDGINIALPEGTSVKAAESGVVAYAGNELKGYGNLILIRHPNGFVSAYANTGDIEVKRGETVKRGQVIAKSGQSGNVATPQLHFELRKGTTPVDPTQYLAGV
ncbi:MAG TPA: peptidoglycan DD-metalloendopeptidase family protein [Methylocella sp.]|nr:peptidoglycan DD-metalloendopeptidase family protein [Methylocella sp.]